MTMDEKPNLVEQIKEASKMMDNIWHVDLHDNLTVTDQVNVTVTRAGKKE